MVKLLTIFFMSLGVCYTTNAYYNRYQQYTPSIIHNHNICASRLADHYHSYPYCSTPGCQVPCSHLRPFCPILQVIVPFIPQWHLAQLSILHVQQCSYNYYICRYNSFPFQQPLCDYHYFNCMSYLYSY